MNSLNLLSSKVIGQSSSPTRPRSRSQGEVLSIDKDEPMRGRSFSDHSISNLEKRLQNNNVSTKISPEKRESEDVEVAEQYNEKTPLLGLGPREDTSSYTNRLKSLVKRIADALTAILATIGAPAVYVVSCFQHEDGHYSMSLPTARIRKALARRRREQSTASTVGLSSAASAEKALTEKAGSELRNTASKESLRSTTSESESENQQPRPAQRDSKSRVNNTGEGGGSRRSIRIKLNQHESFIKRKEDRKAAKAEQGPMLTFDSIKSPTSPLSSYKLTKWPHAPSPPRPLVPRRQPSYSEIVPRSLPLHIKTLPQKTLILDLDETLIHSMAKGNRMSTGHMVEVKLNAPVAAPVASAVPTNHPPAILGPQHPILYYVHERPYCHTFLKKVSKWYKLVAFTASVQEYADPVIDLLEREKKYFAGRYYRQHCTFRNGAYIKDLGTIEPDLSRVMILDNSPMSYAFHEGMLPCPQS